MKLTFFNRHSQVLPVNNNETLSRSPRHGVNESIQEQFETRGGTNPSFPVRIRRRVSSHFQQSKQREPSSPTSSAVNFEESLATNPKHASMLSWRFLMGPHHFDSPLHLDDVMEAPQEVLVYDFKIGRLRSRTQLIVHFLMELHMLRRDIGIIAFGIVWQWVHSVFTNLAYYYHAQLTAAQRVPLQDIAFGFLPKLQGGLWMASEYLVYSMVAIIVLAILSILFISYSAPHGRPLYCIPILRRMLLTLVFCQTLRIISFMCTTLPGASRQCLYDIQPNTTLTELISGPAPLNGNPERWEPPETISDIFWRVDPTNGCGDLMFSSHTIFTMLFVCVVWKYFNWKPLKVVMALCQILIVPLILAARKHYSVDVFTALYVTPLVFDFLVHKLPDLDSTSETMANHYGLAFRITDKGHMVFMWGNDFSVDDGDIPLDLQTNHSGVGCYRVGKVLEEDNQGDQFGISIV